MSIIQKMGDKPTWTKIQGPLSATFLTLQRIYWNMHSAHVLVDDLGTAVSLLGCSHTNSSYG